MIFDNYDVYRCKWYYCIPFTCLCRKLVNHADHLFSSLHFCKYNGRFFNVAMYGMDPRLNPLPVRVTVKLLQALIVHLFGLIRFSYV